MIICLINIYLSPVVWQWGRWWRQQWSPQWACLGRRKEPNPGVATFTNIFLKNTVLGNILLRNTHLGNTLVKWSPNEGWQPWQIPFGKYTFEKYVHIWEDGAQPNCRHEAKIVFVSNFQIYFYQIATYIDLKLQNIFFSNCKMYSSQIAKCICLRLKPFFRKLHGANASCWLPAGGQDARLLTLVLLLSISLHVWQKQNHDFEWLQLNPTPNFPSLGQSPICTVSRN